MSWVDYAADHPFPIQNLPWGLFKTDKIAAPHTGAAIGDFIIDLHELATRNFIEDAESAKALKEATFNSFMELGWDKWMAVRATLKQLLAKDCGLIRDDETVRKAVLVPQKEAQMLLPCTIGDYTDFYASREHASNLGKMFRPGQPMLMENWLHIPVGYHGRASSVVVSGTDIRRPNGQKRPKPEEPPVFGPSMAVDFELEMGAYIGVSNKLGEPFTVDEARKRIFGFSLFNDWSARDIQKWEYVPLGPFLGKNFGSTVAPWIVSPDALEPFLVAGPKQEEPTPLPYLQTKLPGNYDVQLSVEIATPKGGRKVVTKNSWKHMYWSVYQQLCHHAINGCNMRAGDLIASGTISGPEEGQFGSMIETAWQGTKPVKFENGEERKMILDGDTVVMRGECIGDGYRIGFGTAEGKVIPAHDLKF